MKCYMLAVLCSRNRSGTGVPRHSGPCVTRDKIPSLVMMIAKAGVPGDLEFERGVSKYRTDTQAPYRLVSLHIQHRDTKSVG